ncbi:MAG: ribonuclease HI [Clostridia bacterium]|nr:ribonuclease HI [Clostridia bacterium]
MKEVTIYTDGACSGNPGKGGFGVILSYMGQFKEISKGYECTTNNRMELLAAIEGLSALKEPCRVKLWSDSKYLIDAVNKNWIDSWQKKGWVNSKREKVKNRELFERLIELMKIHDIEFCWVKGHDGNPQNERCDFLATSAAKGENLLEDTEYINSKE